MARPRLRTKDLPTRAILPPWLNFAVVLAWLVAIHIVHYRQVRSHSSLQPEQLQDLLARGLELDLLVAAVAGALSGVLALLARGRRVVGFIASNLPVWVIVFFSLVDFGFLQYAGRHIDRIQWAYLRLDQLFFLRGTILEQLTRPSTFLPMLGIFAAFLLHGTAWRLFQRDLQRPHAAPVLLLGVGLVLALGFSPRLARIEHEPLPNQSTQLETNAIIHTVQEWLDPSFSQYKRTPSEQARRRFTELQNAGGSYRVESEQYPWIMVPTDSSVCSNPGTRKNVVLVQLESFSAFSVNPLTPYYKKVTPEFEALTKEGVLLDRFFINAIPSAPAMASVICSIPDLRLIMQTPESRELFCGSTAFQNAGYRTAAMMDCEENYDGMKRFFVRNGFDEVIGDAKFRTPASNPSLKGQWGQHNDGELFDEAVLWMDERAGKGQPFFLWLITATNHDPFPDHGPEYETNEGTGKRRAAHRTMRFVDAQLGRMIRELKKRPYYKDTIFIIYSDHPTWFTSPLGDVKHVMDPENPNYGKKTERALAERSTGDPTEVNFNDDLFVNSWIAGLILNPVGIEPGTRIHWPTSHVDLMPTALDMAGVCDRRMTAGHSLIDPKLDPSDRQALIGAFHFGQLAMVKGDHAVSMPVSGGVPQYYDLSRFPLPAKLIPADGSSHQKELLERFELFKQFSYWALDTNRLWPSTPLLPIPKPVPAVSTTGP